MKALVLGGTGNVGSRVVLELRARDVDVTVLTRHPEKAALPSGVQSVAGDLLDLATIRSVFRGMDVVFLVNGLSLTEAHEGLLAVNGARLAGVKRIAYLSIHRVEDAPYLPHFGPKIAIEAAIKGSKIPFTILRANHFYQNDLLLRDAFIQYGVFPWPISPKGLWRVDIADIAAVAAIALTTGSLDGQTVNLVGPGAITGATAAEIWGRALGRAIRYTGDDLDAWEKQSSQYFPPWLLFDIRMMFEFFAAHGLNGNPEDVERLTKILGRAPRKLEDFARETAEAWARSPSGVTA